MSALASHPPRAWNDRFRVDRIVLFGGSDRTLDLLRLAAIRSDDVVLIVAGTPAPAVRRFADAFAIVVRDHLCPDDLPAARAVLVAIGDVHAENVVVRAARAAGAPVHVADRPLLSDFNLLEFVERRTSSLKGARHTAVAHPAVPSIL